MQTDHLVHLIDPSKMTKQVFVHLRVKRGQMVQRRGRQRDDVDEAPPRGDLVVSDLRYLGCGIPAEYLEHVLEPFSQVEDHLTREKMKASVLPPALARAMTRMSWRPFAAPTSEVDVGTVVEVSILPPPASAHAPNG